MHNLSSVPPSSVIVDSTGNLSTKVSPRCEFPTIPHIVWNRIPIPCISLFFTYSCIFSLVITVSKRKEHICAFKKKEREKASCWNFYPCWVEFSFLSFQSLVVALCLLLLFSGTEVDSPIISGCRFLSLLIVSSSCNIFLLNRISPIQKKIIINNLQ